MSRWNYPPLHGVMIPLNRLATDQRTVAERKWHEGAKPSKPQKPCDHGLFSNDAAQLDLIEMFQNPTND